MAKDGSCGSLTEEVRSSRWSVRTVIPDSGGISVRCRSRLLLTVHRTTNCFLGTSLYFLAESLSPLSRGDGNIPMLWSMEIAVGSDSQSGYNGFLDPKRTSGQVGWRWICIYESKAHPRNEGLVLSDQWFILLVQECKGLRTSVQLNFIAFWTLVSKREEGLWLRALPAQKGDTL